MRIKNLTSLVLLLMSSVFLCVSYSPEKARSELSGMEWIVNTPGAVFNSVLTFSPDDDQRLFVGTQDGIIHIVNPDTGGMNPTPFLTIPNVDTQQEGGLHSLAFHPDYKNNGKFYIGVTIDNGGIEVEPGVFSPYTSHIREYTVSANPDIANTSFNKITSMVQPAASHNDAWMGFGPDGYLYMMAGDGAAGGADPPGHTDGIGNAQDITDNPFGTIRRVDVDGTDAFPADPNINYGIPVDNPFVGITGDDDIWAYGIRNPWKGSFDRATGDLWFGDVGAKTWEEINFQPANSTGGENYGWRLREGFVPTPGGSGIGGPKPPGNVDPVYAYTHDGTDPDPNDGITPDPELTGLAVTGGYVYRGPDPDLYGKYIFGDSSASVPKYWSFDISDPNGTVENITSDLTPDVGQPRGPVAFAEDSLGNLFVASLFGDVFALKTDSVVPGDFNEDGSVDAADLPLWEAGYGTNSGATFSDGDANEDGVVNGLDFFEWQKNLGYNSLNAPIVAGLGALGNVSADQSTTSQVPEPASLSLGLSLTYLFLLRLRLTARAN